MQNNPDIAPQHEQTQQPRSFDQLVEEYITWRESLSKEERDPYLWERILLKAEDDGSYAFGRAIEDTFHGRQREIAIRVQKGVREGNIEQRLA